MCWEVVGGVTNNVLFTRIALVLPILTQVSSKMNPKIQKCNTLKNKLLCPVPDQHLEHLVWSPVSANVWPRLQAVLGGSSLDGLNAEKTFHSGAFRTFLVGGPDGPRENVGVAPPHLTPLHLQRIFAYINNHWTTLTYCWYLLFGASEWLYLPFSQSAEAVRPVLPCAYFSLFPEKLC